MSNMKPRNYEIGSESLVTQWALKSRPICYTLLSVFILCLLHKYLSCSSLQFPLDILWKLVTYWLFMLIQELFSQSAISDESSFKSPLQTLLWNKESQSSCQSGSCCYIADSRIMLPLLWHILPKMDAFYLLLSSLCSLLNSRLCNTCLTKSDLEP